MKKPKLTSSQKFFLRVLGFLVGIFIGFFVVFQVLFLIKVIPHGGL